MKPLLSIIINPLPLIAITVMMSSKLLHQDTRNSCSLPQNGGRELPRDIPTHVLLLFTPLEAGRNANKANEPQTSWLFPKTPTTKSDRDTLVHKWSLPWKKSSSQQLPRTAVGSTRFLICGSDPAQHKQFKHRLLNISLHGLMIKL